MQNSKENLRCQQSLAATFQLEVEEFVDLLKVKESKVRMC